MRATAKRLWCTRLWRIGGVILGAVVTLWLLSRLLSGGPAAAVQDGVTAQASGDPSTTLLISALHIGTTGWGGNDEGFQITNVSTEMLVLTETWRVCDGGGRTVAFPAAGVTLTPGANIWCARNAISFTLAFGLTPTLEYGQDSTPDVPNMSLNGSFAFADTGGALTLLCVHEYLIDTANADGGPWPGGVNKTTAPINKGSMERRDPTLPGDDTNWAFTSTITTIGLDASGNPITGTPRYTNSVYDNSGALNPPPVAINEVAWMGTAASSVGSDDEWIELYNNTAVNIDLNGWLLVAADSTPSIPLTGVISAQGFYLLERSDDDTVGNIPADQVYSSDNLVNTGERLYLYQIDAIEVDVVVYGNADPNRLGWSGPAAQRYANGVFATSGQILFRKRSEQTGLPLPDANGAADWANDTAPGASLYGPVREGDLWGKRVSYPGWDWEAYTRTLQIAATANVTVGIAPDNAYTVVVELLSGAQDVILIEGYTWESVWLTGILTERIHAGVQVTMLLEGAPAGGLPDGQLWNCQQIVDAGGAVYFMHNDDAARIDDRYANQHAKIIVVDGRQVLVGSENFGNHAMPIDDKSNGTAGNRGVLLITDQPALIAYAEMLFARDLDLGHPDIVPYGSLPRYTVPLTYTAVYSPGGGFEYPALFSPTLPAFQADWFEVVQSPETSQRYSDGLIGLVLRAGPGDEVYAEQMYERVRWGKSSSTPADDPNPRLEAYIQAARQGASVRILLDKGFDDTLENVETTWYLLGIAETEGLDIEVRRGDPTYCGIHNKLVLVRLGNEWYAHVGSINGSESSSKINRELALQVRSKGIYDYLKQVFDYDWSHSSGIHEVYLPVVFKSYVPEANHVLISEVVFNPPGADDLGEWVELYNPTARAVDLSGWHLGDAVNSTDYERLYVFPSGTNIPPGGTLVIARQAVVYQALNYPGKSLPDWELNSSSSVPDLIPSGWGTGEFALGNAGDQVLLLDPALRPVDVLVYGTGSYPGVVSFGDVGSLYAGSSLERWPANRDSDDCARDFRSRSVPQPGAVDTN
ncbi:MAG: lamin tail domain-containing protein [Anaerolineae bacterium]|nr:lamin tail domain-containing protein [Anaerolineae bacterium]